MVEQRTEAQAAAGAAAPSPDAAPESPDRRGLRRALDISWHYIQKPLVLGTVFSLAYGVLGLQYYQAFQQAGQTQGRIEASRALASAPVPDKKDLGPEIVTWTAARDAALTVRVAALLDSDMVRRVTAVAQESGVVIQNASSLSGTRSHLQSGMYDVTTLTVKASGSLSAIEGFIARLEDNTFDTIEIQSSQTTQTEAFYSLALQALVYSEPAYEDVLKAKADEAAAEARAAQAKAAAAQKGKATATPAASAKGKAK